MHGAAWFVFVFAQKDCFFGAINLTKKADLDEYSYSGYGIGSDSRPIYLFPNFDQAK